MGSVISGVESKSGERFLMKVNNSKMKVLLMSILMTSLGVISNCNQSSIEIHLLPNGYIGVVTIVYNQTNGNDIIKEGSSAIYRIPINGVLLTKEQFAQGAKSISYYYEINGSRKKIDYVWDKRDNTLNKDSTYIFLGSSGSAGDDNTSVKFTTYLVGHPYQMDSLADLAENVNPLQLVKITK